MIKEPLSKDLEMAKVAVRWDDETSDRLLETLPTDNSPLKFMGTDRDLSAIRSAMKRYERVEAGIMEDKAFYDARFRLQFMETRDDIEPVVEQKV